MPVSSAEIEEACKRLMKSAKEICDEIVERRFRHRSILSPAEKDELVGDSFYLSLVAHDLLLKVMEKMVEEDEPPQCDDPDPSSAARIPEETTDQQTCP